MDIEDIKTAWQSLSLKVERLERDNRRMARDLAAGRATTAKKKLEQYYTIQTVTGLCLPVLAPYIVEVLNFQEWVAWLYGIFGVVMALLALCFRRYIKKTDYMTMPVVDAIACTLRIRLWQRRLLVFGITTGAVVLGSMALQLSDADEACLIGMIIGIAVGLPIGIMKERRARNLIKQMQKELESCIAEE